MISKIVLIALVIVALITSSYLFYILYQDYYSPAINFKINYAQLENQSSYSTELQFYPNMRFKDTRLSYTIDSSCDSGKIEDMQQAFDYINNKTGILDFYPSANGEIEIFCGEEYQKGDLFVAGEGGPVWANTGMYNLIQNGTILLLSSESCSNGVAIHELLHVFGFNHSTNKNSIMYPISSCNQVVTRDIILELDRLYSIKPLPELYFEEINATRKGRYINLNFIVKNRGLDDGNNVSVILYVDNKEKDIFNLGEIEPGAGKIFYVENDRVSGNSLKLEINSLNEDMDISNNQAALTLT